MSTAKQRKNLADLARSCGATIKLAEVGTSVSVNFSWGDFESFVNQLRERWESETKKSPPA